ncbi:hypothetical protein [Nannocystis sp. SCPEA4]|uniref:hypothetical protein n=1 Tax=Nannocystis sp. SCPEA4 TaxID=2996787 RepID=UPI00226E421F|nr:hypothetical protein [Nannocystis sp. SCPEA4]MCY1056138.1 hypothetical protein [Nannocystis sp. SCPEA4]
MQLADLLAREGYSSRDVPALLSWAHARADALLQTIDPDSPVGVLLDGLPGHVVKDSPVIAHDSVGHSSRSSNDYVADDEDVVDELPVDLRRAVTAATTSSPQPAAPAYVDDDPDSGFGGFARFQSLLKLNRPYPYRSQEPVVEERPTLARSFALAGERQGDRPPPSPPADLSATLPLAAALGISSEESAALVLGIPDEDTGETSGLSDLFDPDAGPDIVDSFPLSMSPRTASSSRTSASGFIDDDDVPLPTVRRGTGTARMATLVDDDDAPLRSPVRDDDDAPMSALTDDDDVARAAPSPLTDDDDESSLGSGALLDDDDLPLGAGLTDDDEVPPPPPRHGALVEHEGGPPPVRLAASSLLDDDDDAPPSSSPPPTIATELDADETIAEPLRTRDTPPMPGLPAIDIDADNGAPVLRHRTPKKKVVELGSPVAKPRAGGSGAGAVSPRGPSPKPPPPRKPPPPPARKPPPPPVEDDIQELSRVELIEDLPSYLRDDDE